MKSLGRFVYYSPPNFFFLSIEVVSFPCMRGLAHGSPWLQTLNCNSLLILNKPSPPPPGEISGSLFQVNSIIQQHPASLPSAVTMLSFSHVTSEHSLSRMPSALYSTHLFFILWDSSQVTCFWSHHQQLKFFVPLSYFKIFVQRPWEPQNSQYPFLWKIFVS